MAFTLEASSVKLLVDIDHCSFTRHSKKLPAWTNNAPEMWRKLWISITPWLLAALAWLYGACWPSNIVFVQLNKTQTALSALVWGWHQCVVAVVRREAGASICCPSPLLFKDGLCSLAKCLQAALWWEAGTRCTTLTINLLKYPHICFLLLLCMLTRLGICDR